MQVNKNKYRYMVARNRSYGSTGIVRLIRRLETRGSLGLLSPTASWRRRSRDSTRPYRSRGEHLTCGSVPETQGRLKTTSRRRIDVWASAHLGCYHIGWEAWACALSSRERGTSIGKAIVGTVALRVLVQPRQSREGQVLTWMAWWVRRGGTAFCKNVRWEICEGDYTSNCGFMKTQGR